MRQRASAPTPVESKDRVAVWQIPQFDLYGPSKPTVTSSGKVSQEFVQFCYEVGIQCTVTADTRNWQGVYQLKNLKDRTLLIRTKGFEGFLTPGGPDMQVPMDDVEIFDYTDFLEAANG